MIRRGLLSISMLLLLLLLSIFTLQYHALVQPLLPSRKILARSLQVVAPFRPKKQCHQTVARKNVMKLQVLASDDDDKMLDKSDLQPVAFFLLKAALVGVLTGLSVVLFKSAIAKTSSLFYENLADILPKPSFYWPLALYPLIGSMIVSFLVWWKGKDVRKGIDSIARSIDADEDVSKWELPSILDGMDKKVLVDAVLNSDIANMFQLTSKEIPNEPEEIVFAGKDSIETPVGMAPRISSPKVKPNLGVSTTTSTANSATTVSSSILTQDLDNIEEARDDPNQATQMSLSSIKKQGNNSTISAFDPFDQLIRLAGAVATLGSGCSLGPEGPAVEIGAGWSRIISGIESSQKERHHLFLAGTAAGVAAGFNAPISGVFFAIECGNRYLSKNTVKLDEDAPDGPRADIAAIVIAAALADIAVGFGLNENAALSVQGNGYAMVSPLFELPLYVGLGLLCGAVSVAFTKSRDFFTETFTTKVEGRPSLSMIPRHLHPILGGALCGIISVFLPQTLFVGYTTLDQLIAGKLQFEFPLLLELLGSKLLLSAFSLGSGLIGGVFAPSLFFGATLGTAYHTVLASLIDSLHYVTNHVPALHAFDPEGKYFSLANAPAYATVGAAATLGALFRAPLTSSMLMFELTQNHDIVLPVLVSTGIAGLFAELLSQSRRLW